MKFSTDLSGTPHGLLGPSEIVEMSKFSRVRVLGGGLTQAAEESETLTPETIFFGRGGSIFGPLAQSEILDSHIHCNFDIISRLFLTLYEWTSDVHNVRRGTQVWSSQTDDSRLFLTQEKISLQGLALPWQPGF